MNILTLENLSKAYGSKILFKDINLGVHSQDRIGLIGRNGQGKSSLLKIIAGLDKPDQGEIIKPATINIEYLPQRLDLDEDLEIIEAVFRGESPKIKLLRDYQRLIKSEEVDGEKVLKLAEKMDKDNIWELESEAKKILTELGIEDFKLRVRDLSGGQKRRVSLASALISPSDLLILDEPTNHLDDQTIVWLEHYLANRKGALLMVTHDRYFLDRVTNRIIEIRNQDIYNYDGNYNYYVEKKSEEEERLLASERKRKSLYKQELAWMRQGIKARGTRQKARIERFHDLSKSKLSEKNKDIDITVSGQRLGKKILEMENISKSYGDRLIIKDFSYIVLRDDRIGIVGENGAGKSTLMDIIAKKIQPDSGSLSFGETVKVGYFSQEAKEMDESIRAIDYIKEGGEFIETDDGSRITAGQMMERFLFDGALQYSPIEKLSGGERRRLYLLRVLMEGPNFLILDEPTNDLDIDSLNILEDYIDEFEGPVIIVSHDRYLLDKLVEKTFHIKNARIKNYPGNYSYWKERLELEDIQEQGSIKKEAIERKSNRELKFSYNEKREWETIEADIAGLEQAIENLDLEMGRAAADYLKLQELDQDKVKLEEKLEEKMDRWMYLSELKEKIDNQ